MSPPSLFRPFRRTVLLGGLGLALGAAAPKPRIVTMLGDSLTAGYGLPAREALPAQLERLLNRQTRPVRVRAAGVSGDTSADGLARLGFSVQSDTEICIVALGGNDLLQGLEPRITARNLDAILSRLKARKIGVILAGMTAPSVIGAAYAKDYNALFPTLARTHRVAFYPDLLAGVAGNRALNQRDGIHPTAEGARRIAVNLAPLVLKTLQARA